MLTAWSATARHPSGQVRALARTFTQGVASSPTSKGSERGRSSSSAHPATENAAPSSIKGFRGFSSDSSSASYFPRLSSLVREGRHDQAYQLLCDLRQQETVIEPQSVYLDAAKSVLDRPEPLRHVDEFKSWLALVPATDESLEVDLASLHKRIDEIRASAAESSTRPSSLGPSLLDVFTAICAEKGYTLGNQEVRRTTRVSESFTFFSSGLSQRRHASSQASHPIRPPLTEEETAVFQAVLDELPDTLPETEMEEMSDALFEDEGDDDYAWAKAASVMGAQAMSATRAAENRDSLSAVDQLRAAVEKGNYAAAGRLIHELHDVGTHIPPSELYAGPLLSLLKDSYAREHPLRQHTTSVTDAFSAWFALLPDAEHVQDPTLLSLEEVRRHIFQTNIVNTDLVLTFGLAAARKGYAEQVSSQLMHFAMGAFPDVQAALRYMNKFLEAAEEHRRGLQPQNAVFRPALSIRRKVYKTALRALVRNGHHDVAVDLLTQKKRKLGQAVPKETLQFVAAQLQKARRYDLLAKVNPLLEGSEDKALAHEQRQVDVEAAYLQEIVDKRSGAAADDDALVNGSLASRLSHLRRAFSHGGTPPTCATLVNFMDQYYDSGRCRALRLLRQRALRNGTAATTAYTFAQMVFLRRRKMDTLLIQSFASTFYLSGVPREPILRILQTAPSKPIDSADVATFVPAAREVRKKAWPDSLTTALVWHSVTALTVGWQAVSALYHQLLAFAAGDASSDSVEGTVGERIPALMPRPAIRTEAFMPFVRRLMLGTGLEWGPRILEDMLRLGIAPTIYHFTDMAGVYARKNEVERVMMIVDMVEGAALKEAREKGEAQPAAKAVDAAVQAGRSDAGSETSRGSSAVIGSHSIASEAAQEASRLDEIPLNVSAHQPRKAGALPGADLIFYICVIRGFIIARNLEGALAIEERMWRHYDYQPGNPYYESYFEDLRRMQEHSRRRQQAVRQKWVAKYGPELAQEKVDVAIKERSERVRKLYGLTDAEALNSVHYGPHGLGKVRKDSQADSA